MLGLFHLKPTSLTIFPVFQLFVLWPGFTASTCFVLWKPNLWLYSTYTRVNHCRTRCREQNGFLCLTAAPQSSFCHIISQTDLFCRPKIVRKTQRNIGCGGESRSRWRSTTGAGGRTGPQETPPLSLCRWWEEEESKRQTKDSHPLPVITLVSKNHNALWSQKNNVRQVQHAMKQTSEDGFTTCSFKILKHLKVNLTNEIRSWHLSFSFFLLFPPLFLCDYWLPLLSYSTMNRPHFICTD